MSREEREAARAESALVAHFAQRGGAIACQAAAGAAGLIGAAWHGWPSILLGAAGVWLFRQAMPAPTEELDKHTGRLDRP